MTNPKHATSQLTHKHCQSINDGKIWNVWARTHSSKLSFVFLQSKRQILGLQFMHTESEL